MSFDTAIGSLISAGKVLAYHRLTDAAGAASAIEASGGTALTDAGGVGFYGTFGNAGGPISGLSTFLTTVSGPGGSLAIRRSGIVAGAGLDKLDELTYLVSCRIDLAPTTGTPEMFGRIALNMGARLLTSRVLRAGSGYSGFPSGERTQTQPYFALPLSAWMMLALTYSVKQGLFLNWVNAEIVEENQIGGARTGTTSVYGIGGNAFNASWSGLVALNFAASKQLLNDLYIESGLTTRPAPVGIALPSVNFGDASATVATEGLNGGKINTLKDGYVRDAGSTIFYRRDQFAGGGRKARTFYSVSDSARDIAVQACNISEHLALRRVMPAISSKVDYWGGDGLAGVPSLMPRQTISLAKAFATIHKFRGLGKRSYPLEWVKTLMNWQVLRQQTHTDGSARWAGWRFDSAYGGDSAGAFFAVSLWGEVLLMIRDSLDDATYQSWLDALDGQFSSVDSYASYGPSAAGSEHYYYTNGNFETSAAGALYKRWILDGGSPTSPWKSRFDRQWSILTTGIDDVTPSSVVGSPLSGAGASGFGLKFSGSSHSPSPTVSGITSATVNGVTPARADGADGVGWITEYTSHTSADGTLKTTPGLDWDYHTAVTIPELLSLHELSRDTTHLRALNVAVNSCLPRIGTGQAGVGGSTPGAWNIDCTGGARHDGVVNWNTVALEYLVYNGLEGGRVLSGYDLADHFKSVRQAALTNSNSSGNPNYWGLAEALSRYVTVDPSWEQYA